MKRYLIGLVIVIAVGVGLALQQGRKREETSSPLVEATPTPTIDSVDSALSNKVVPVEGDMASPVPSATATLPIQSSASSMITMDIRDHAYSMETLTITKGTVVTWINQDEDQHDVVMNGEGEGPRSPLLNKGDSYRYTFDVPGTYEYHCSHHPTMKGTVTVIE